jgi:hypothetical protein
MKERININIIWDIFVKPVRNRYSVESEENDKDHLMYGLFLPELQYVV